ncbi:MAG: HU family DNA-binding protein, partial [Nocardioidaceae bacterium]
MNKSQLIEALAGHFEGNKKQAGDALQAILDTVTREVAKGEKVAITGFGAFEKVVRPSRMVRNPRTGERKRAKKSAVPKFKAGAEFKGVVSGTKPLPKAAAKIATAKK